MTDPFDATSPQDRDTEGQALALAVRLFEGGDPETSNAVLEALEDVAALSTYALFCRGRNFRYLGQLDEAIAYLQQAVLHEPPFVWTHYELAVALMERGDVSAAAEQASIFLRDLPSEESVVGVLNVTHCQTIIRIAHASFEKDPGSAFNIYESGARLGAGDYLSSLRIAESMFARGDVGPAHARMVDLQALYGLDPWGKLAFSRILFASGEAQSATSLILGVIYDTQSCSDARFGAFNCLVDMRQTDLLAYLAQEITTTGKVVAREAFDTLRFRINLLRGTSALVQTTADILSQPCRLSALDDDLLVDAVFLLTEPSDRSQEQMAAADLVIAHLATRPLTRRLTQAMLHHAAVTQDREKARALLDRVVDPAILADPFVAMRRFEHFCYTLDDAAAWHLFETDISHRTLDRWENSFVLRFLSEQGCHRAAIERLEQMIHRGQHVPANEYLMLQICRRDRAHLRILDAIDARSAVARSDEFGDFRQMLIDDICIARGAEETSYLGTTLRVSARNAVLVQSRAPAHAADPNGVICYFCTDKAYFYSALTFLMSYKASNPNPGADVHWIGFVGDDVPLAWQEELHRVATSNGLSFEIIQERAFLAETVVHLERYGLFAGGNRLSRAAYFRIYAALLLQQRGSHRRACYFDTDIICEGSLGPLFVQDFAGQPLLARREEIGPEILRAAAQNEIEATDYFNSGVLVFDLTAPDLAGRLEKAIWLSEKEPHRLCFHDQCALNIAFKGATASLDPRFNVFLRPDREAGQDVSTAVLLHYLNRPKPWEVAFRQKTRFHWESSAAQVRRWINDAIYRDIVSAANSLAVHDLQQVEIDVGALLQTNFVQDQA